MKLPTRLALLAGPLLCAAVVLACEDGTPPPKVPEKPGTGAMPTAMPTAGAAGPAPQVGVADPTPGQPGEGMNPQALALYQQGMQAFANGDLKNAQSAFTQATTADPKAYQAYYSLGVVQERLGSSSALANYQKSFSIQPAYELGMVAYGLLLAKQGSLEEADTFLTEKRARLPKSAAIAGTLAEVKSLLKDTGSAQRIAQEALKLDPDYRPAMVTIARDHYRNRRLDLALYALKAILDGFSAENPPRDADNAEAHLLRGLIWEEQGNRAGAMQAFQEAVQRRPDLITPRLQVATYLLEAGSAAEAVPLLRGALNYDADNLAAHLGLGDAYRLVGNYAEAKKEFEWVLQRDKSMPQVHYNLGLLYLFAPEIPGMKPIPQVKAAIASLKKYEKLRRHDDPDDHTQLLRRADMKKAELEALAAAAKPQPIPATPDAGAGATDAGAAATATAEAGAPPPTPTAGANAADASAGDGG